MTTKHTPEPWKAIEEHILTDRPSHSVTVGQTHSDYDQPNLANAQRIVLAVNFVEGLTNEQLTQSGAKRAISATAGIDDVEGFMKLVNSMLECHEYDRGLTNFPVFMKELRTLFPKED